MTDSVSWRCRPIAPVGLPSGGTASTSSDSGSSSSAPWWRRAADDIVHGGAESADALRESAEAALAAAWKHRQGLEQGALIASAALLTLANAAQLGADPLTDGAEGADIADLAADVGEDAGSDAEDDAASCGGQSFTSSTKVLLASGVAIPISQLRPGDEVLATHTKTGKTQAESVTAVMVKHDTDLYDLTINDGKSTSVIDTTSNHLFYVPGTSGHNGRWVKAQALRYGTHLRTPDASDTATVIGGRTQRQPTGWMWDLTVPGGDDHDFYIDTTTADVLVHNCKDLSGATQVKGRFPLTGGPQDGTLYRVDGSGNVTNYTLYDSGGDIIQRVNLTGRAHAGIPTPHVQPFVFDQAPDGRCTLAR